MLKHSAPNNPTTSKPWQQKQKRNDCEKMERTRAPSNCVKHDTIGLMHKKDTSSDDSDIKCGSDVFDKSTRTQRKEKTT